MRLQLSELSNPDAESAVIGAILLKPSIIAWLRIDERCFFDPRYRHVWAAMVSLDESEVAIDTLTVSAQLKRAGVFDAVGGTPFLTATLARVFTADNVGHYVAILHEMRAARELALLADRINARLEAKEPAEDVLGFTLRKAAAIDVNANRMTPHLGAEVEAVYHTLQQSLEPGAKPPGILTGISKFDELTGGIPVGIPTIIAASPGGGKSTLCLEVADYASANGDGVLVCSYEDPPKGWAQRWLARKSGVDSSKIRAERINGEDLGPIGEAAHALRARKNLVVERCQGMTVPQLIRYIRGRRRELGLRLVIVDYIQRCPAPYPGIKKHEQISENATLLSDFASTDEVALIIASQLSRNIVDRDGKKRRPTMQDLSGSKGLEESGKLILALHEEPRSQKKSDPDFDDDDVELPFGYGNQVPRGTPLDILILKNHMGVGEAFINATWDKPHHRIECA